jgi:ABC-type transport system involved in cytochrome c biogenesis permease component
MFFRTAWLVLRKDFAIEARSWEVLTTTLFFAASCVLVFAFAFVKEGRAVEDAASGILWIAVAFSGTLRPALYVGKLLGMLAILGVAELLLVPMVAFMFQATLFTRPLLLLGLLAGGTIGFAAVGTLFAAMLVRARSRDVLLPILLYPITIPVIIAGVRGTGALLETPPNEPTALMWISILAAFDVVFVTLALWTFEPLMTE